MSEPQSALLLRKQLAGTLKQALSRQAFALRRKHDVKTGGFHFERRVFERPRNLSRLECNSPDQIFVLEI